MNVFLGLLKRYAVQALALALVLCTYYYARPIRISQPETLQLAAKFSMERQPLDIEHLARGPLKTRRAVHPSLERISAWISGTGAAATLGDLDGDGLENDLVLIDPRLDQVVVVPALKSASAERYPAFAIDFQDNFPSLPFDSDTMSPTGSLIGDFNEDGANDLLVYFWGRTPIVLFQTPDVVYQDINTESLTVSKFQATELMPELVGSPIGRWYTHAAVQADFDGDGHLDLFVGNFFQDGADILNAHGSGIATVMHAGKSRAKNGGGGKLLRWRSATTGANSSVKYEDDSELIEALCGKGWVLAAGAADLDRDGLPELYIAHDFGPDRLLHNRSQKGRIQFALCEGQRSWTTPRSFVLGRDSFKGMGVGFGDINHDGYLDIYVSNIADQWALHESHFLWVSTGRIEEFREGIAPYQQQSERYGLSRSGWGWDSVLVDLDNDGTLEALQATGFAKGNITSESKLSTLDRMMFSAGLLPHGIPRWPELQAVGTTNDSLIHDPRAWPKLTTPTSTLSGYERNPVFAKSDSGRYVDISADIGLGDEFNTRGIAVSDMDGDGRLDIVYANQWEPSCLFHNTTSQTNSWLSLRLLLPVDATTDFAIDPPEKIRATAAIGASASLIVDELDGTSKLVTTGQVLSGTGHSGHGGQEIHFGLGSFKQVEALVNVRWRTRTGQLMSREIALKPGRHTVVLGVDGAKHSPRPIRD